MKQIDSIHITSRKGRDITSEKDYIFGTNKGSYSFVVSPRSIERFECEYVLKISKKDIEKFPFNKLILHYYNEKNHIKKYVIKSFDSVWKHKNFDIDEEWNLIK